jgi:hypothetical protein
LSSSDQVGDLIRHRLNQAGEMLQVRTHPNIEKITQAVFNLPPQEQLELMEKMINRLKARSLNLSEEEFNWDEFYGIGKGLWDEDAQEYVNRLREDR